MMHDFRDPQYDPMEFMLDAVENDIVGDSFPAAPFDHFDYHDPIFWPDDFFQDNMSNLLGALEAHIENTDVSPPPTGGPELSTISPLAPAPTITPPVNEPPPLPPEPTHRYWTEMAPPEAARPYYA